MLNNGSTQFCASNAMSMLLHFKKSWWWLSPCALDATSRANDFPVYNCGRETLDTFGETLQSESCFRIYATSRPHLNHTILILDACPVEDLQYLFFIISKSLPNLSKQSLKRISLFILRHISNRYTCLRFQRPYRPYLSFQKTMLLPISNQIKRMDQMDWGMN